MASSLKTSVFKAPLLSFTNMESGQWIVFEKFGTPTKAYLYDGDRGKTIIIKAKNGGFETTEIDGVITLKGMVWPESKKKLKLHWTELVPNEDTAKNALYPEGHPRAGKKKYTSYKKFLHSSIIIGSRTEEDVPYLRQKEIHPIAVEFICRGGGSYVIIVQVTVEIHNPIAATQLENFLDSALGRVTEALLNWGKSKTFEEARQIDVDDKKQIMIKDKTGKLRYYLEVISEDLKEKIGVTIPDVSLIAHFIGDASASVFQSENKTLEEQEKVKQVTLQTQARMNSNTAQQAENATDLEYQTGLLNKIGEVQGKLLKKEAKIAKNYGGKNGLTYLSIGEGGASKAASVTDILAAIKMSKKGGTNE